MKKSNRFPLYFYLDGKLHKRLVISRATDSIVTWCYPLGKRVAYTYSDVRARKQPAFYTREVAKMINRSVDSLSIAINNGDIPRPQVSYGIDENRHPHAYFWSEQDIMNAYDHFSTVHRGRPRKDGIIKPQSMPTKRELRAIIRNEQILYVKGDDGEFRPVWLAEDFT